MAITYNWTIAQCEHDVATGGITVAHWRVSAEETVGEKTHTASAYGSAGFTPDASSDDFVAYNSVTEETVLGWVWQTVNKEEMETSLASQIESAKTPVTQTGLPWAS